MQNRRNFLKQAGMMLAGGLVAPQLLSSCSGKSASTTEAAATEAVKKNMAKDTVLLNVECGYNAQSSRMESKAYYTIVSDISTDEEYLDEELKEKENGK